MSAQRQGWAKGYMAQGQPNTIHAERRALRSGATPGAGLSVPGWLFLMPRHAFLGLIGALAATLDGQRGRLFYWSPVCLALGIGLYFALRLEPGRWAYLGAGAACGIGLLAVRLVSPHLRPIMLAPLLLLCGFLIAGARAHLVTDPVLTFRYYGPVEGRVVKIDRSASDALRLTLDHVRLRDMAPHRTPARVRVSLHGDQSHLTPGPGMHIAMTAHLSPPPGPTEPGGFDFQRMAWFDRLGAVGYTRVPALRFAPDDTGAALTMHRLRTRLSAALQTRISGQPGAFAAAILTGDRSGIAPETAEHLRGANLSHLLAISGLHMGLLTGVVFFTLRLALAMIPGIALRAPLKKIAAVGALLFGFGYLAMSGWNVATERAFVMVSVMLAAVLLDRQAISLRAVALAALIILCSRPEVLPEPGFQMSFAATTALVAVFSILRRLRLMERWPPALRAAATVVLSSAIAGIATAPVAAAHFNRISDFGLIANVAAVPVMGSLVMPAAVVALILAPLGLAAVPLAVMDWGIRWILFIAETVSSWEGAVSRIIAPPPQTLPMIALGGLFLILWRGRAQLWGAVPMLLGFVLWAMAERPALLISDDGGLVGRMGQEGRVLSKPKGAGFAARSWLENDGDIPDQKRAAGRAPVDLSIEDLSIIHVIGRGWQDRAAEACLTHDIVILNKKLENRAKGGCLMFDLSKLRQTGALAISRDNGRFDLATAYGYSGLRLWNTPALRWEDAPSATALAAQLEGGVLGAVLVPDASGRGWEMRPR